jgi:hypothetical protein
VLLRSILEQVAPVIRLIVIGFAGDQLVISTRKVGHISGAGYLPGCFAALPCWPSAGTKPRQKQQSGAKQVLQNDS